MPGPRFFVALDLSPDAFGATIALPDAVAHHATRVVRLAAGAALLTWATSVPPGWLAAAWAAVIVFALLSVVKPLRRALAAPR